MDDFEREWDFNDANGTCAYFYVTIYGIILEVHSSIVEHMIIKNKLSFLTFSQIHS